MNIHKVTSETNVGEYILNCYFRSDKKYPAGLFCGRMLIKRFNKSNIINIMNIWLKNIKNDGQYFHQFKKGLLQGLNGK